MKLNREKRIPLMPHSLLGMVVQVHMGDFDLIHIQCIDVLRKLVVLSRYVYLFRVFIAYMIVSP